LYSPLAAFFYSAGPIGFVPATLSFSILPAQLVLSLQPRHPRTPLGVFHYFLSFFILWFHLLCFFFFLLFLIKYKCFFTYSLVEYSFWPTA
jgi:hypothetical protein